MAVMAAHTSAREMSLSRYQKMTTISISAAILAGDERLAVPSVACSVIARSSSRPPSGQASASRPVGARGSVTRPARRRTGDIAGNAPEVASRHGALDTPGPAAAGTPVPLGSAGQPGGRHHPDRPVRRLHGQGDPDPDPDRAVHRGQPRPGGASAGPARGAPRAGRDPDLPARLRPGRRVPDLGDPAAGRPGPQPGRRPARLPDPAAGALLAV